jgi:hypothetical protein
MGTPQTSAETNHTIEGTIEEPVLDWEARKFIPAWWRVCIWAWYVDLALSSKPPLGKPLGLECSYAYRMQHSEDRERFLTLAQ